MPSVDIALPLPFQSAFTYLVPDHLVPHLRPGARVLVPFGSRKLVGFIWGPGKEILPAGRLKPILALLEREPLIVPDVQRLCRWIAGYYFAPPGEALALAVPARALTPVDPPVIPTPAGLAGMAGGPPLLDELVRNGALPLSYAQADPDRFAQLEILTAGGFATVGTTGGRIRGGPPAFALPDLPLGALADRCGRSRARRTVIEWLAGAGAGGRADGAAIRAATGTSPAVLSAMVRAGLLQRVEQVIDYALDSHVLAPPSTLLHPLTRAQETAYAPVREAIGKGGYAPFLLQGITGSGKTEVYLHAVSEVLARGGRVLYLVPEIALTPAAAARLRALFPGRVSLIHSALSEGERLQEFHRARSGEARIVMGTRSALFMPLDPLRLVVVDEEQEAAYKQEESPRYQARDGALVRAREAGAAVILGSATPSMESMANAERGRYTLLTLDERVEARPLPRVTVVDLRREAPAPGDHGRVLFSKTLLASLTRCFAAGEQAILLLNRRGWAPLLLCRLCGYSFPCPDCSVGHTLHHRPRVLLCHYCGHRAPVPQACPECGGEVLEDVGFATEKVAERFRSLYPGVPFAVLDRDTAARRGRLAQALRAFGNGSLRALIGTQIVAKGHDFPGVSLVGILSADQILSFPDFRSAERLFALLVQVAGRSGRGDRPGEVIVQTAHPEHYAIRLAARQDVRAFYAQERGFREAFHFPPAGHFALLSFSAPTQAGARGRADAAARVLRSTAQAPRVRILGPAPAPLERLQGRHRWQILLRSRERPPLHRLLELLVRSGDFEGSVDVDPHSLL